MAQPAVMKADVEKKVLTGEMAVRSINPMKMNDRGELTGVTLSVPIFGEKDAYLVVNLPKSVARELADAVSQKPEAEREMFVREWVKRNQAAIYSQYISSGGKLTRFRYDVVPVSVLSATPKKAMESDPYALPGHTLISPVHVWNQAVGPVPPGWLGTVPEGWRVPGKDELPQEIRERANFFQPKIERGKIPVGDARIEEFDGKAYMYLSCYHTAPAPPHPSITVLVQRE